MVVNVVGNDRGRYSRFGGERETFGGPGGMSPDGRAALGDLPGKANTGGGSSRTDSLAESIKDSSRQIQTALSRGREIHQLATVEAGLSAMVGYCGMCKARVQHKMLWYTPDTTELQMKAIEYAGKVIEAIRNYEMNLSAVDRASITYVDTTKAVLAPISQLLAPYRTREGVEALLKDVTAKYNQDKQVAAKGEAGEAEPEVAAQEPGLEGSLFMTLVNNLMTTGNIKPILQVLGERGLTQAIEYVQGMSREGVVKSLRGFGEKMREVTYEGQATTDYMNSFIAGCSSQRGYGPQCEEYKSCIAGAKAELQELRDNRLVFAKDFASAMTWPIDVLASIAENVGEEEVASLKMLAVGVLMGQMQKLKGQQNH